MRVARDLERMQSNKSASAYPNLFSFDILEEVREVKALFQRNRGFRPRETWSLDLRCSAGFATELSNSIRTPKPAPAIRTSTVRSAIVLGSGMKSGDWWRTAEMTACGNCFTAEIEFCWRIKIDE